MTVMMGPVGRTKCEKTFGILLLILSAVVLAALAWVAPVESATPREVASRVVVRYLTDRGNHGRFVTDSSYREEIIDAVFDQSIMPPALVLSIIFHESTFRDNVVGKLGEGGLMQVSHMGAQVCHCGGDLSPRGQIRCGTCWYQRAVQMCGVDRALTAYMSGECVSPSVRTETMRQSRLRLAARFARDLGRP